VAGDEDEVVHLEDMRFEGPNLDLPSPPPDLPYEGYEDWRAAELLQANGIPASADRVLDALRTESGILLAAAAHTAGALGVRPAVRRLREIAAGPDDDAGVEAAYALARLGDDAGRALLREALERPVGPYLSPVLAAGDLARLGDPAGRDVIREGLGSELLAVRMLATKQLAFLAAVDGDGARPLFEQALADPDPAVRRQAEVQLPAS
jgi:HEAT repeat protein